MPIEALLAPRYLWNASRCVSSRPIFVHQHRVGFRSESHRPGPNTLKHPCSGGWVFSGNDRVQMTTLLVLYCFRPYESASYGQGMRRPQGDVSASYAAIAFGTSRLAVTRLALLVQICWSSTFALTQQAQISNVLIIRRKHSDKHVHAEVVISNFSEGCRYPMFDQCSLMTSYFSSICPCHNPCSHINAILLSNVDSSDACHPIRPSALLQQP